ncbi:MAG: hypothetical protein ACJ77K_12485 [Bacteroidia bacterium]
MKKLICCIAVIYFLGSCSREVNSGFNYKAADSVALDESKVVITREPWSIRQINDSVAGAIIAGQQVSLYELRTGKNIRNFNTRNINFDSLTKTTYQQHYKERSYHYDALTAGGLSNGNSQMLDFIHSDKRYYIYVNTTVDVNYDKDTAQLKKYENDPQIKAIREKTGEFNLIVQEYLEYLFVTDEEFKLLQIIPLYENELLKKDGYSPLYQRGFMVSNNAIIFSIIKDDLVTKGAETTLNSCNNCCALAKVDLDHPDQLTYLLPFENMNMKNYNLHHFFSSLFRLKVNEKNTFFSNGKGIYTVETGKSALPESALKANEWISDFSWNDHRILLATYMTYKKKHPSDTDIAYGVDSIANFRIRVMGPDSGTDITEKVLAPSGLSPIDVNAEKIVWIVKDKEHYYLKSLCREK